MGMYLAILIVGVGIAVGIAFVITHPGKTDRIKEILASEISRIEGMNYDSFKDLCYLQPVSEITYGNEQYVRTFSETKYDEFDRELSTRLTISSTRDTAVKEYEIIRKKEDSKEKIYKQGFKG